MFPIGKSKLEPISCNHIEQLIINIVVLNFSFLETSVPLSVLINAAREGNEKEVEECAIVFRDHANKLVEVSNDYLIFGCHY